MVMLLGTAGGLYGYRKYRINSHIDGLKADGLASLERDEHATAYHELRGYLSRHPDDLEALRGFAQASEYLVENTNADPTELINTYQRILQLDGSDVHTRFDLMVFYDRLNFASEAIEQADALIAVGDQLPADLERVRPLEVKANQLARIRKLKPAIEACRALLAIQPDHLQTRLMLLRLMLQDGAAEDVVLIAGGELLDADPDSINAKLVLGYAYQLTNDNPSAQTLYRELAAEEIDDVEAVSLLAQLMDQSGLAEESLTLILKATNEWGMTDLRPELARRLWERGRASDVLVSYSDNYAAAVDEPGSYPFVVMALRATEQADKAQDLQARGAADDADEYVKTWSRVFAAMPTTAADGKDHAWLQLTREAATRYPNDPHLGSFYANALLAEGLTEHGLIQWEQIAQQAPAWSLPMQRVAEIMLSTQRDALALEPSRAAVRRAPQSLQALLVYFRAVGANLDRLSEDDLSRVRYAIGQIEEQQSIEALIPLRAELAARDADRDQAKAKATAILQSALDREEPLAPGTQIALIRVSQRHGVDLTEALIQRAYADHGPTPELALAQAINLLGAGKEAWPQAQAAFNAWMAEADGQKDADWQLARARLERAVQPDRVKEIWSGLLNQFPGDARIAVQAIQDQALWQDESLDLIRKVIKDTRQVDGQTLTPVRIAAARLALMDAETDRELFAVATKLNELSREYPYLSEPYSLLGICYEQQGNRSRALEAYASAHRIRPSSDALLSSRVRLHRQLGETQQAENLLLQHAAELAGSGSADPYRLAQTYVMVGQLGEAVKWAEKAFVANPEDRETALFLARLYQATGREADTLVLFDKLLAQPDLPTLVAAASFYMQIGEMDRASATIDRLNELELEDATEAVVRGHFALSSGDVDSAQVQYEIAANSGDDVHARTAFARWISIRLNQGDLNGVIQVAKAAAKRMPGDRRFSAIVEHELLIRSVFDGETVMLVQRLLVNPELEPVVVQALRLVGQFREQAGRESNDQAIRTLAQLRKIADQNTAMVELQTLLVRRYIEVGQAPAAAEIAARTLQAFPNSEAALLAAADANMAAQQWDRAADIGNQVAGLNPAYRPAADAVAARAALRRQRPREALRLIEPHLEDAANFPESFQPILRLQIAALIASNQSPDKLGPTQQVAVESLDLRGLALDQIVQAKGVSFATASEWIEWADSPPTDSENRVAMQIRLATAWHIAGMRNDEPAGRQRSDALLDELEAQARSQQQARLFRAIFAEERGDLEEAAAGYQRVLESEPNNLIALNNASMVLMKLGQTDQALVYAQAAAKAAPQVPIILDTLANVQLAAGKAEDAQATIERAIAIDPEQPSWHITLCKTLMARQDAPAALKTYQNIGNLLSGDNFADDAVSQEYLSLKSELDQLLSNSSGTLSPTP